MIRLVLMRHGNTFEEGETPIQVGARTDLPLTAFGRKQAKMMAAFLKNIRPDAIFAGGLKRQWESAEIIAQEFGLVVRQALALDEIDYGLWEGLTAKEIAQKWPIEYAEWEAQAKWQRDIFNGSLEDHQQKLQEWLQMLRKFFENQVIFGVTSNGLLRFFRNEKVKTGHYCEFLLESNRMEITDWNQPPKID